MIYISNTTIPSKTANTYQSFQMCQAFAEFTNVFFYFPGGVNFKRNENYFTKYGSIESFKLTPIYSINLFKTINPKIWFKLKSISFNLFLVLKILLNNDSSQVIYSRASSTFSILNFLKKIRVLKNRIYLEIHDFKLSYSKLKDIDGFIVLNQILENKFAKIGLKNVLVAHDGVNLENFKKVDVKIARTKLGLDPNKIYCTYSGRFTTMNIEKGIPDIIKSNEYINDSRVTFLFIGGPMGSVTDYNKLIYNLDLNPEKFIFIDYQELETLNLYLNASDILLMPFPNTIHFSENMSPLKMFEYMAIGKPIVASDLPTITEVLNDEMAFICKPDDPKSIGDQILKAISEPFKPKSTIEEVKLYTWTNRANQILNFIG